MRPRARRLTLSLALSLTALTPLAAPAAVAAEEGVSEFTLSNGMDVVVIEDHRSPAVVQMVCTRSAAPTRCRASRASRICWNT